MSASIAQTLCKARLRNSWEWVEAPDRTEYMRCAVCHRERDTSEAKLQPWTLA